MVPVRPSLRRAARPLARALQVALAALVVLAPDAGPEASFAHYGLALLVAPFVLRRVGVRLRPRQHVWLGVALTLHPLGALYDWYEAFWWFDHVTHFLSATLVVALAYQVGTRLRPVDPRRDRVLRVASLAVILFAGGLWEVYELHTPHLTVYGPTDTGLDVAFDLLGWVAVAAVPERFLGDDGRGPDPSPPDGPAAHPSNERPADPVEEVAAATDYPPR